MLHAPWLCCMGTLQCPSHPCRYGSCPSPVLCPLHVRLHAHHRGLWSCTAAVLATTATHIMCAPDATLMHTAAHADCKHKARGALMTRAMYEVHEGSFASAGQHSTVAPAHPPRTLPL